MNDSRLDQARDSAADLLDLLDEADPGDPIDEDRIDELVAHVSGDVRAHNDRLAEQSMASGEEAGDG